MDRDGVAQPISPTRNFEICENTGTGA